MAFTTNTKVGITIPALSNKVFWYSDVTTVKDMCGMILRNNPILDGKRLSILLNGNRAEFMDIIPGGTVVMADYRVHTHKNTTRLSTAATKGNITMVVANTTNAASVMNTDGSSKNITTARTSAKEVPKIVYFEPNRSDSTGPKEKNTPPKATASDMARVAYFDVPELRNPPFVCPPRTAPSGGVEPRNPTNNFWYPVSGCVPRSAQTMKSYWEDDRDEIDSPDQEFIDKRAETTNEVTVALNLESLGCEEPLKLVESAKTKVADIYFKAEGLIREKAAVSPEDDLEYQWIQVQNKPYHHEKLCDVLKDIPASLLTIDILVTKKKPNPMMKFCFGSKLSTSIQSLPVSIEPFSRPQGAALTPTATTTFVPRKPVLDLLTDDLPVYIPSKMAPQPTSLVWSNKPEEMLIDI
ncbi:hypothetical protein TWF730_002467 [Orbilia blumenaviensis]|uniref:Uncharacterized protein n=1 Tax=Orbilia blumenaviensis TaxID=1796055 RepID=A0AAV9U9Z9_9PEZI